MQEMTKEEYIGLLLHGTKAGKIATVRKDGRPHVVPILFDLDGETSVITTEGKSVKAETRVRVP
jgi:hypothetical protein